MDVYVQPSHFEGVPNAVLEAMAAGLPVVATNVGGVPEVVEDGATGIIVPPKDCSALTRGIARLLRDPELRRAMGRSSARRAASRFSMAKMVEDYEHLFSGLGAQKSTKTGTSHV
jgi:glycosyltransferase involved in cell wall biosynthesis